MAARAKALLVDSDTLIKWIFNTGSEIPVLSREASVEGDYVRFVAFPTVADIYQAARYWGQEVRERFGDPAGDDYDRQTSDVLFRWFHELVNVLHAEETVSKDWLALACDPPVHENANREHLWMTAFARFLLHRRFSVTIASEDPGVYIELRDRGVLQEVQILT